MFIDFKKKYRKLSKPKSPTRLATLRLSELQMKNAYQHCKGLHPGTGSSEPLG
jgi:hypothetical protein